MAGLNLTGAVLGYQRAQLHKEQMGLIEEQKKERAQEELGNQAFSATMDASKAEWAMNGAQGEYRPSDATMLKAAEARGMALAKAGSWKGYMKNEVTLQPQRLRIRANALSKYEQDGDFDALLRSTHQTIADGKDVVAVEKSGGMPGLPSIGREPTPTTYKVKFSDGVEKELDQDGVQKFVAGLKLSLADPQKVAEREIEINFRRTAAEIEAEKQKAVEREKGDQARKTDDRRTENDLTVEGKKADYSLASTKLKEEGDDRRAKLAANTSLAVAGMKEAGDDRRAKTSIGDKAPKPGDEVKDAENLLDTLAKAGISGTLDAVTQTYKPDALTQQAAARINQYRKAEGLSFDDAQAKVRAEMVAKKLIKEKARR